MNHRVCSMKAVAAPIGLGLALSVSPLAAAGTPQFTTSILIQQDDVIPGYGTVTNINDISINDQGDWIVDVSLTGEGISRALVRNGEVWLAPGDPIEPDDFVSSVANQLNHLNNSGDVTHRPGLEENHSGVYFNFLPLLIRDQVSQLPDFAPGSEYIGFFRGRGTDDGRVLAIVTVSDTDLGTLRVVMWLDHDDRGNVTKEVVAKRHDPAPGTEEGVTFNLMNTSANNFAINNDEHVLFSTSLNGAPSDTNGALYIDDALVARQGDPSPIPGSNYANIGTSGTRVDLSNHGDYIFLSTLTDQPAATNTALLRNNMFTDGPDEVVIQRGDPAPGFPDRVIDHFGSGAQPHVTDEGDVVFYARLSGDTDTNQVLYLNDEPLLQKGVSTVDGQVLTTVCGTTALSNGITQSLMVSDSGEHILIRAVLADGSRAAVLVSFEEETFPGDLTGDGTVGVDDLLILLAAWGDCPVCADCPADLTGDCAVGVDDLLILLANWSR